MPGDPEVSERMNGNPSDRPLAKVVGLSHVVIEVSNLPAAIAFYQSLVDFEIIVDQRDDASQPSVKGLAGSLAIELEQGPEERSTTMREVGARPVCLSFAVSDARGAHASCREAGITVTKDLNTFFGASYFSVRDPDGHIVEFIELPNRASNLGELLAANRR